MGRYIPKLAVTDPSGETLHAAVPYEKLKVDARDAIRDALREVAEPEKASGLASRPSYQPEAWQSADGKTITATFRSLAGEQLTLILADGRMATLPLSRFAEASQTRAKELGAQQ